jgi:hypothetical protein
MNRRSKERLDLQLVCRVGPSGKLSTPPFRPEVLMSENFSRGGALVRWLPTIPLPPIGCRLTVDVELPALPGAHPRAMRCAAQVVRIDTSRDSQLLVAVRIEKIRFVAVAETPARPKDLASMLSANSFLN